MSARERAAARQRARELGFDDVHQYERYLRVSPWRDEERCLLRSRTQRRPARLLADAPQLDELASRALPEICSSGEPGAGLSIWCAADDDAYEACTMALLLASRAPALLKQTRILSTRAPRSCDPAPVRPRFPDGALRDVPGPLRGRCMIRGRDGWRMNEQLSAHLDRRAHRLTDELGARRLGRFDIIVCRRPLIGMPGSAQRAALRVLERRLREGGWLCLDTSVQIADRASALQPTPARGLYRRPPANTQGAKAGPAVGR